LFSIYSRRIEVASIVAVFYVSMSFNEGEVDIRISFEQYDEVLKECLISIIIDFSCCSSISLSNLAIVVTLFSDIMFLSGKISR